MAKSSRDAEVRGFKVLLFFWAELVGVRAP